MYSSEPAGTCLWCGEKLYYERTSGAPFQEPQAVERVNQQRIYGAYRSHMIDKHPAVLEVLGT